MKIPYALVAAVSPDDRCTQMQHAVDVARERGYPRLIQQPIDDMAPLALACYGPSLASTWELLRDLQRAGTPIVSMSGATHFLADRGVTPDYHIDMDPRPHKVGHLDPPVPGVHYLMASVCPPRTWELLRDARVTLWHTYTGHNTQGKDAYGWVFDHDPAPDGAPPYPVIHGGSTIGLTALHIGGFLGRRHFDIFGMDGSFAPDSDARHAGVHYGKQFPRTHTWAAEGRTYHTTEIMANAVAETINTMSRFPIFGVFYGDGLTQALIREANLQNACTANQEEKAARIRRLCVTPVSMPAADATASSFWDLLLTALPADTLPDLISIIQRAERLRQHARYNTGSIPIETALLLRALCCYYRPAVAVEIGTFIGVSTYALTASQHLFTCDKDNNCLGDDPARGIHTHPYLSSTGLLRKLVDLGYAGKVDFFFFDGRLVGEDVDLIRQLAHAKTIFAFDDCSDAAGANKGIANLQLLRPAFDQHVIGSPHLAYGGRSTLGVMLPLQMPAGAAALPATDAIPPSNVLPFTRTA